MIQNSEILNKLSTESKTAGFNIFPRKLAKKIQPVVSINVDNKQSSFFRNLTAIGFGVNTIFRTSDDRDTYITNISMNINVELEDKTQNVFALDNSGKTVTLITIRSTANDTSSHKIVFPIPIKLLRNGNIVLISGGGAGGSIVDVHISGFEVDTLEKADG